jgi:CheY-like chemotaxis protein
MSISDKKLNILIADDEKGWLNFHKENLDLYLKNYSLLIYEFQSTKEAYEFANKADFHFDIIISDLQMENIGEKYAGEWLIENLKLQNSCQNAKFIIISSAFEIKYIAQKLNTDYINKRLYYDSPFMLKLKLQELFENLEIDDEF